MPALKILVCGDVEGHFKTFFNKVAAINEKRGPFEYLLCVGDFFGPNNNEWNDVLSGKILVPVSTYILGPNRKEHVSFYPVESAELTSKIIYLGKRGILSGSSGLKIAYISGLEQKDSNAFSFSKNDITELISSTSDNAIDILLSSQWPHGITTYAKKVEFPDDRNIGSTSIAYLAKHLKPRYHFSGISGAYYERLPYRNHDVLQEMAIHTTRFIGLGPVVNNNKCKWIYAFSITPFCLMSSKDLIDITCPSTECPYKKDEYENQFFFQMESSLKNEKHSGNNDEGLQTKRRNVSSVTQDSCWFCLTNPNFERQLLISIGEHSYITLAKGGILSDHLLIIPMEHIPASIHMTEVAEKEVSKYKNSLINYFYSQGRDVVFFERNYFSPHLQIQVIPIPARMSSGVANSIHELALIHELEFDELSKFSVLKQIIPPKKPYFHIEICIRKKIESRFLHIIDRKFPLQFGRMVLTSKSVLNVPERVDWKECKLSSDEELKQAVALREDFKAFDNTKI